MRFSIKSFLGKEQPVKEVIKQWILAIEEEQNMPTDIVALNFGLFQPYGIELIGASCYDAENDDWACEEDFVPEHRFCPALKISGSKKWEEVLEDIVVILKEIIEELPDLKLWKVEHITTGFSDGDLVKIR